MSYSVEYLNLKGVKIGKFISPVKQDFIWLHLLKKMGNSRIFYAPYLNTARYQGFYEFRDIFQRIYPPPSPLSNMKKYKIYPSDYFLLIKILFMIFLKKT